MGQGWLEMAFREAFRSASSQCLSGKELDAVPGFQVELKALHLSSHIRARAGLSRTWELLGWTQTKFFSGIIAANILM